MPPAKLLWVALALFMHLPRATTAWRERLDRLSRLLPRRTASLKQPSAYPTGWLLVSVFRAFVDLILRWRQSGSTARSFLGDRAFRTPPVSAISMRPQPKLPLRAKSDHGPRNSHAPAHLASAEMLVIVCSPRASALDEYLVATFLLCLLDIHVQSGTENVLWRRLLSHAHASQGGERHLLSLLLPRPSTCVIHDQFEAMLASFSALGTIRFVTRALDSEVEAL
ncbi:hypothetical protein BU23DRAFT_569426 [Bimuria novae-zelandiae CBS 107.79]|uniref:Secreted protein n=1 Tax=Bimuria novae-zelandiae CBS 107.79 TaxID=1447943 RepID=A0A6A5VFA5_9PLEO|nr:hypothetical protein BU23DRAFT_569426 [Bimuria novae-zelandiae CBS 107.79]